MNDTEFNQVEARMLAVEQKVNLLLVAAAIQIFTILSSWISYLFGSFFWFIIFLAIVGGVLYAARDHLPQLSGKLIRYVFSKQSAKSESEEELM